MKRTIFANVVVIGFLMLAMPVITTAQPASIPHHKESYLLDSSAFDGPTGTTEKSISAFRHVVQVSNAPWLQLHFGEHNLGERSYVTITSLKDRSSQHLDAKSLLEWQGSTAYFNGDAVEVELHVAAGDKGVFIRIREITVGEWVADEKQGPTIESICGGGDDRVASNDPRAGRIVPVGCTGWIISNGAYLTAGHCAGAGMQTLQFNVPPSNDDGTINHPPPQHQYPIIAGSVRFADGGVGNDWAIFDCGRNAQTGLLPVQAQGAFFRMSRDSNPPTVRVTGYGVDGPPPNFGNPPPIPPLRNADSQTQQTHAGPNLGEFSGNHFRYRVDTQGGNSGGPIIVDGTTLTIGIHTHGGCTVSGGDNRGTSFENDNLENVIQEFPGLVVRYVDRDHPVTLEDGTVFRPYHRVNEAVSVIPAGGIVSIVAGSYNESMTISRAMTLTAPVGTVTIGTTTSRASIPEVAKNRK